METTFFGLTSETGQILSKMFFLLKISHTQINYAFQVFWSIFTEIDWKPFGERSRKWQSQNKLSITLKLIFSQRAWKGENPVERFWFDRNNFYWSNQWNGTNITKNFFSLQDKPRRSDSQSASPLHIVPKPSVSWRPCGDLLDWNSQTLIWF